MDLKSSKNIFILVIVLVVVSIIAVVLWRRASPAPAPAGNIGGEIFSKSQQVTNLPQTNPFSVKSNPFKQEVNPFLNSYKNPFE